jgi:hypothetical protein
MPEGGPPDTTPPEIVRTEPAAGAVGVPRVASITIQFSKPVDQATLTPGLFISPPLAGNPEVKWSGRIAYLRWADSLRPDVTYRFTFGGKLSDRHSNRLKEPVTIAFSTGSRIDSCRIRGNVWTPEPVPTGLDILAYQLDSSRIWPPDRADFVTQAGPGGQFDLPYLPRSLYRLLAVGDRNHNGRPDQNELYALADADVDLKSQTVAEGLRLFARPFDTTAFRIGGCSQSSDGSLLVGLTHAVDTTGWCGAQFLVTDSATHDSLSVAVLRPVPPKLTIIPILCELFAVGRTYQVVTVPSQAGSFPPLRDMAGRAISPDTCRLSWSTVVDTVGPRINWTLLPTAENATSAASPIQIGFNEPVDTVASRDALRVRDTLGTDLAGTKRWLDPRHLVFSPVRSWPESVVVVVSLDSTRLLDRHGHLAPPQPRTWTFRPLLQSQMGTLAGEVEVSDSGWTTVPCHLEASPVGKGAVATQALEEPGAFEMSLPAGRWILGGFLDLDRDGRWSGGHIQPYKPAEPRTIMRDTVTVRARFTLDGAVIRF